jgi:putative nucleotidyltransferase with HDIG domain
MQTLDPDIRGRLTAARLPVLPQVLLRIMAVCESDDAGTSALAELLGSDAALSARVLQIATSSAYYRGDSPVGLERALATIGMDMLRTLLITESVYQSFSRVLPDRVDLRGFWKHSLATAIASRELAGRLGHPHADEAYLAGLLHDIGRLALLSAAPNEYVVNFFHQDDLGLCAVEERTLRTNHTEVGAWLIERFGLDSFIADAILYHHEPMARLRDAHPLVRCVALADLVVRNDNDIAMARFGEQAGIAHDELVAIQQTVAREVVRVAECLGIDLSSVDAIAPPPEADRRASAHDEAADKLREQMRDLTLVSHAATAFTRRDEHDGCVGAITDAAMVIFELEAGLTMTADHERGVLVAHAPRGAGQRIAGFAIPLAGNGPLALASRKTDIAHITQAADASIGEAQLLRFFGTDRLVGVPLMGGGRCHGMLVGALSERQLPQLIQREPMLRAFGSQAGAALASVAGAQEPGPSARGISADFRLASKKMAHEVNNPLSIIRNYLAVLEQKLGGHKDVDSELGIMAEEIDRIDKLIHRFANPEADESEAAVSVNACIRHVVQLFRASESLREAIDIGCTEAPQEVVAAIDRHSLQQILVNLIKNAIEAMPGGGRIMVRHHGAVRRNGAPFTRLEIVDNGPGIPASMQSELFQRGGSTKGGQRGFGLTIVHELVNKAGGAIVFHSDANGTRFEIVLPAPAPASSAATADVRQPTQDGG